MFDNLFGFRCWWIAISRGLSKDEMEVIQQEMRFRETGGGQHNEPGEFAVLMDQN